VFFSYKRGKKENILVRIITGLKKRNKMVCEYAQEMQRAFYFHQLSSQHKKIFFFGNAQISMIDWLEAYKTWLIEQRNFIIWYFAEFVAIIFFVKYSSKIN
jgi:hypothetical protein